MCVCVCCMGIRGICVCVVCEGGVVCVCVYGV